MIRHLFASKHWLRGVAPYFLSLSFLFLLVTIVPTRAEENGPVVVGYYPSWPSRLPVSQIRWGQFTHLIHAFVTIRKGSLHTAGNLPSRQLTQAGHAAGVKVLLGFGGADSGGELAAMTRNPATESAVVQGLVQIVRDNGYDGVDVDWEFPTRASADGVVDFIVRLRQALQEAHPGALVTMPVPSDDLFGQYFDGPRLAPLLDLLFIMTYDAHGPWKAEGNAYCHAGFDSPLNDTTTDPVDGNRYSYGQSVDYWRGKSFTNQQLVAGVHFSGHGFMVKKWGDTPLQPSRDGDIDYLTAVQRISQGWKRHWDDQAGVPWLQSPPGLPSELITYDDPRSVTLKGAWVRAAGIRGIFFWEISEDFTGGHNELVEAARNGLGLPNP